MQICSWNVNGIRACIRKGFMDWLETTPAEIVGLQETRARLEQIPKELVDHPGWHLHVSPAAKAGYSGVALLSRRAPDAIRCDLGDPRFDDEGRLQVARFGRLVVANVYFPNGSGPHRDHSRVPYKLEFYRAVWEALAAERKAGKRVLVMGDFNTAHEEVDLARPKTNTKTSGFLPVERDELDRWLKTGWIDTFRSRNPDPSHYTWWSQRFGVRERNVGWRIDYVLASKAADRFVSIAMIWPNVMGSDHCPVGVEIDPNVCV